MTPNSIIIFTDGAARRNPGPGGFSAIVILPKNLNQQPTTNNLDVIEIGGSEKHTTNNRMELMAAISALALVRNSKFIIHVYTDSSYLVNGITKWIFGWQKNGWKTSDKEDVGNKDLWKKLVELTRNKIDWKLVAGHIGIAGNSRADELATAFADGGKLNLYRGSLSNYQIKNILDFSPDKKRLKEKTLTRRKTRKAAYSYVSLLGGIVRTHKTWAECERRVKGKNAKYKKVFSKEEETGLISKFKKTDA